MKKYICNPLGYLLVAAMLLTACSSTQINSAWRDPSYQSRPAKIMVIGVAKNPLNRRLFEDEFVAQLKAHGTAAIASYSVLTDKQQDDRDAIAAKVKEMGADAILITRLVSTRIVRTYVPPTPYFPPPYYGAWPDYYWYGYRYMYTPGYVAEDEYAVIETNLYDSTNDKLIWAATSDTGIRGSNQKVIKDYIEVMVKKMRELDLLGKLGKP